MPVEYVDEIPAAVPTGRVVVHNTVVAHTPLGFNGPRAWLEAAEAESGHLERCDCTWAPELAVHYRVAPRKSRMPHGLVMQRRIALADLLAAGRRRYEDRYRRGEVTRARLIAHLVELDEWHFAGRRVVPLHRAGPECTAGGQVGPPLAGVASDPPGRTGSARCPPFRNRYRCRRGCRRQ